MNTAVASAHSWWKDYVDLTKPRIMLLVLVTAFAGMWLAAGRMPDPLLVLFTLLGTGLASASSAVLNNYIDRDVDKRMMRTQDRALPAGRVSAWRALLFGLGLGLAAFALLAWTVNSLAAWLAVGTIAFYVLVYTLWLKRRSPLCTAVGGVAGALPPVIGWAAVSAGVDWPALALFGILFLWQPPHFWALALLRADEYRQAGLPMLPVVRGERVTKRQMLLYTLALLPASAAPFVLNLTGWLYLTTALALGIAYLTWTVDFVRRPLTRQGARGLFLFSILYLFSLFLVMFLDAGGMG